MMVDDRFGFVVNGVSQLLRRRFDEYSRGMGITRPQWRVLLMLSHNAGINQARLADSLGIEHITLCRLVDRLEAAGWVERRPDPADRRVKRLHLTPAAHPLLEKMRAIGRRLQEDALAGLSNEMKEQLIAILEQVKNNLSDEPVLTPENAETRLAHFLS